MHTPLVGSVLVVSPILTVVKVSNIWVVKVTYPWFRHFCAIFKSITLIAPLDHAFSAIGAGIARAAMEATLRKRIISSFKLQGFSLKSDALSYLVEALTPYSYSTEFDDILDRVIEAAQQQDLKSAILGRDIIEKAVDECNEASDNDAEKAIVVIDAFSVPAYTYNSDKKKFFPKKGSSNLYGGAVDKAALWKERYSVVHQATLRHELFAVPASGTNPKHQNSRFQLKTIEYLLSTSGSSTKVLVLGMLVQIVEGKYHLEDPSGTVELDISNTQFQNGLFTENSLVLAEGMYDDGVFRASAIGLPPPETASRSRAHHGNTNFFGGPLTTCAKASAKLQAMEKQHFHEMFVFLADVFLDDERVMSKLKMLFTGYCSSPPMAFVFMGNFSCAPFGSTRNEKMARGFDALADLIAAFPPLLEKSQFLFVPGSADPSPGNILPQPPLPSSITQGLSEKVPCAVFCTNPCRIQFCTQEIVVFREDLLNKLCRNYVKFPNASVDMSQHLVKTLLSQAHLCPLPLHVRPVYWQCDHALRLYPLPDLIVLGDYSDPFTVTDADCTVVNTGSFPRNGFEFKAYFAGARKVDDSALPDT